MRNVRGFEYTIATGRLMMALDDFHAEVEKLMGRSVWTHEMGMDAFWMEARRRLEAQLLGTAHANSNH